MLIQPISIYNVTMDIGHRPVPAGMQCQQNPTFAFIGIVSHYNVDSQASLPRHWCECSMFDDHSQTKACDIVVVYANPPPKKNRHLYETWSILGGQRAEYQCHDYIINPPANGRFRNWLNFKILNLSMEVNLSGMFKERRIACYLGSTTVQEKYVQYSYYCLVTS